MKKVKYLLFEEAWDNEGLGYEQFCKNIFILELNHLFSVNFVPQFDLKGRHWPPVYSNLQGEIMSNDDARYLAATNGASLVIADNERAGKVDFYRTDFPRFDDKYDDSRFCGLIFYLSDKQYSKLENEITPLARRPQSAADTQPISNLKGTLVYDFVVNTVLRYIEENLGGENPDYLHHLASRHGLIPTANLESENNSIDMLNSNMLQPWQEAIMKYENRLAEFIRLAGRSRDAGFLKEFENKVKTARAAYQSAMLDDADGEKTAWLKEYFSDVMTEEEEVKKLFSQIGFEW